MPKRGASTSGPPLTHAVMATIIRVCGKVPTRVEVHELSSPPPQVHLYIADAMLVIDDLVAIGGVRRRWEQAAYAARRIPSEASPTWLQPHWTSTPVATGMRLTRDEKFQVQLITGRAETATPTHLRITIGRVIWQVTDRTAYRRIGAALRGAENVFSGR